MTAKVWTEEGEERGETGRNEPLSGTITSIGGQARDPERVSIFLNGSFAFGLGKSVLAEAGLKKGDTLTAEQVAALLQRETIHAALLRAYSYIAQRSRSEHELTRYLGQKGYGPETVEAVIARLRELHYVDDEVFALSWVENRQRFRPRGAHLLRAELRQKGVERGVVEQAIEEAGADERELALAAADKKLSTLKTADYQDFSRKLGGFLMRRGFASDVVWDVVRHLWSTQHGEAAPPLE